MNLYTWTIKDITAKDGLITHAYYSVKANDGINVVETEGHWWFSNLEIKKQFSDVKEEDVASWIEQETTINGVCHIKSNLDKQLEYLANQKKSDMPWKPVTFKVTL